MSGPYGGLSGPPQKLPPESSAPEYPTISEQDYFDVTLRHLVNQGARAVAVNGHTCKYLTDDGLRCAVGAHIPDGHPAQRVAIGVASLKDVCPELAGVAWPNTDQGLRLAATLQLLHDDAANWSHTGFIGFQLARRIAERFRLSTETVDALAVAWPSDIGGSE